MVWRSALTHQRHLGLPFVRMTMSIDSARRSMMLTSVGAVAFALLMLVGAACGLPADEASDAAASNTTSVTTEAEEPDDSTTTTIDLYAAFLETTEGRVFIESIRASEALVVGEVFSEFMSDSDLVAAALALCEMETNLGFDPAIDEATTVVGTLDWNLPAHRSMLSQILGVGLSAVCDTPGLPPTSRSLDEILPNRDQTSPPAVPDDIDALIGAFLDTVEGQVFIKAIRDQEDATAAPVFTQELTDTQIVRFARGVCSTLAELGPDATAEIQLHQQNEGWTSPADNAMVAVLVEAASGSVCATVGS